MRMEDSIVQTKKALAFRYGFSLAKIPIDLDNFFAKLLNNVNQIKGYSMHLVIKNSGRAALSSGSEVNTLHALLFLTFIKITLGLNIFKVNLFATIHLFNEQISCLAIVFKLDMLSCCKIRHVSFAYNREAELDALVLSLIYEVNSSGPITKP